MKMKLKWTLALAPALSPRKGRNEYRRRIFHQHLG